MSKRRAELRLKRFHPKRGNSADLASSGVLESLGLRIERMLYVGVLLLVACLGEMYLTNASVSLSSGLDVALGLVREKIKNDESALLIHFEEETKPEPDKLYDGREQRVADMRRYLGMSPVESKGESSLKDEYKVQLKKIVSQVSFSSGIPAQELERFIDVTKPPKDILQELEKTGQSFEKRSVAIWGLEVPTKFSVKYGGTDWAFPVRFIANSGLIALAPILIAWFGSFSITRQRELLLISKASDYKLSFPHILNLLPVFDAELHRKARLEDSLTARRIVMFFQAVLRSGMCLFLCGPMLVIFGYSSFHLVEQLSSPYDVFFGAAALISITVMFCQVGIIAIQEFYILWNKAFYE